MEEYIKSEIKEAIRSYSERDATDEWKSAEEEFKKISYKVEELIYGDEDRHTDKVSHQAIRFARDIPSDWNILGNILYGADIEKILPCILFTWLLNMNQKLWGQLQNRIRRRCTTFKDKRIAALLAKSESKTDNAGREINIADIFFDNISKIPNNCDFAFMMVIKFLALFELSVCAKADKTICITWFENKYGILRHIFKHNCSKNDITRAHVLNEIMEVLSHLKTDESSFVEYSKKANKYSKSIKDKIMKLDFSSKENIENEIRQVRIDIFNLEEYYLPFRYELFKSNYSLNGSSPYKTNFLSKMCLSFDMDLYIEELIIENLKSDNSQFDFVLKDVTAKIENISKLYIGTKHSYSLDALDDDDEKIYHVSVDFFIDTNNYNNEQHYADFSKINEECVYRPDIVNKWKILCYPHNNIIKGTLKILSAKCNAYNTEFKVSCDNLEVDEAHMTNIQFNFKKNSDIIKNKAKKEEWYNSIFLLLVNEETMPLYVDESFKN